MTPKARWMYLKIRYMEIPKILLKAHYLKVKKLFTKQSPVPKLVSLDKSFSA